VEAIYPSVYLKYILFQYVPCGAVSIKTLMHEESEKN